MSVTALEGGGRKAMHDSAALIVPSLFTWILATISICAGVGLLESFPSLAKMVSGAEGRHVLSGPRHCDEDRVLTKLCRILGWMGIICGCCMLLVLSAAIPFRMIVLPLSIERLEAKNE